MDRFASSDPEPTTPIGLFIGFENFVFRPNSPPPSSIALVEAEIDTFDMATTVRDCGSCSVDEKSKSKATGKRKGSAIHQDLKNRSSRGARRAPRIQLAYDASGDVGEDLSRMYARAALSSMNKKCRSTKQPKYELVEALGCVRFFYPWMYHCNFIARPVDGTEAEEKLVFAELKSEIKKTAKSEKKVKTCTFYCILGPADFRKTETGPSGCESCDRNPGFIVHPESGGFTRDDRHECAAWLRNPSLDGKADCA